MLPVLLARRIKIGCVQVLSTSITAGAKGEEGEGENADKGPSKLCGLTEAAIPYVLAVSDIIYGLASGCTIKSGLHPYFEHPTAPNLPA